MNKIVPFDRDVEYLGRRAALAKREGRLLDAVALYYRMLEREPENQAYRMDLAQVLSEMGCHRESNRVLAAMLSREDAPADCYFALCCNYAALNDYERAYRAMVQLMATDPKAVSRKDVGALFKRIVVLRAIIEGKDRRSARIMRLTTQARTFYDHGQYRLAERLSRAAVSMRANELIAAVLFAKALYACGEQARASEAIELVLNHLTHREQAIPAIIRLEAVQIYKGVGEREKALAEYDKITFDPAGSPDRYIKLAAAAVLEHDEDVRALLPRALSDAPYDLGLLHMCAVNRVREGRPLAQASSFWTRMLIIDPTNELARYYLKRLELGDLSRDMPYTYDIDEPERKTRAHALKRMQWKSDRQIMEAWQSGRLKRLLRWGTRSSDRTDVLMAHAILARIDEPEARALICEGRLDKGIGADFLPHPITRPRDDMRTSVFMVSTGDVGGPMPVRLRRAMKKAVSAAQAIDAALPAKVIKVVLANAPALGRWVDRASINSWAAALMSVASGDAAPEVSLERAAALMDSPMRRVKCCAGYLRSLMKEESHENH